MMDRFAINPKTNPEVAKISLDDNDDEAVYGDFEDLETGEIHASTKDKQQQNKAEEGVEEGEENQQDEQAKKREERARLKEQLKEQFNAEYDDGEDENEKDFFSELKETFDKQA